MNLETIFKRLIVCHVAVTVLALMVGVVAGVSEGIAEGLSGSAEPEPPEVDAVVALGLVYQLVLYPINVYLVYTFKRIGRPMLVVLTVAAAGLTLLTPLDALHAMSPLEYVVGSVSWLMSGAVLTMMYFTELRHKFNG